MKNISFKYKLVISILGMSIIPLIINSIYSLNSFRSELEKTAYEKLNAIKESKNASITRYLDTVSSQVVTLSHDKMIVEAAKNLSSAFKKIPNANEEDATRLKK